MTIELEQEFFRVFGIEPKYYYDCNVAKTEKPEYIFELKIFSKENIISCCKYKEDFEYCKVIKVNKIYPEITAEKLLEMICLINKNTKHYDGYSRYFKENYKDLKDEILEETLFCYKINCLFNKEKEEFKHQIQQLFKD